MATPHLAWPIRVAPNGNLATVEQDSVDDIAACVEVVLRTRPGELAFHPRFGTPDLAFRELQQLADAGDGSPRLTPITPGELEALIAAWEPRGGLLVETRPAALEERLARLNLYVSED